MPPTNHSTVCGAASEHAHQHSPSAYETALRKKIQQQAFQISSYRSQVAWSSEVARCCEEHTHCLHPTAVITNVIQKVPVPTSPKVQMLSCTHFLYLHATFDLSVLPLEVDLELRPEGRELGCRT
jgi:hypothetical protein